MEAYVETKLAITISKERHDWISSKCKFQDTVNEIRTYLGGKNSSEQTLSNVRPDSKKVLKILDLLRII